MSDFLTGLIAPSALAWLFPVVLLFLKFSFRNFVNPPKDKAGWTTVAVWFAFDIVFVSISLCSGLLLARVKVADGLAPALLVVLLVWIVLAVWVSFAATRFNSLVSANPAAVNRLGMWFFMAYIPAGISFYGSVTLLGLP